MGVDEKGRLQLSTVRGESGGKEGVLATDDARAAIAGSSGNPSQPQTHNRCGLGDGLFDMNVDHPTTCSSASDLSTHSPSPTDKRVSELPQSEHVGWVGVCTGGGMSGNACINDRRYCDNTQIVRL